MSEQKTHECPVKGCEEQVNGKYLMCRAHWARVPAPIQAAVMAAYQAYKGNRELRPSYMGAAGLAVRSVSGEIEER